MINTIIVRNVTPETDTYPMMGGASSQAFQFKVVEGEYFATMARLDKPMTFYALLQEMGRLDLSYRGENPMAPGEFVFQSAINSTW